MKEVVERKRIQDVDKELFLRMVKALRGIFDPEIPVNIYDLGLIYDLLLNEDGSTLVRMTLTAPNCPEAERIPMEVYRALRVVEGVHDLDIELTFDPPWSRDRMSAGALLALGLI